MVTRAMNLHHALSLIPRYNSQAYTDDKTETKWYQQSLDLTNFMAIFLIKYIIITIISRGLVVRKLGL